MAYTKYSLTPANNNATPPDGAPEGMLPSAVNDTMRDMMAQIRDVGDGIRNGTYTMTAPVITGGSITGVALSGNTFTNPVITGAAISTSTLTGNTYTNPVITGGSINNTPIGASTANTGAFTTLSASGATTFSGATVVSGSLTANTFSSSGATITGGSINSTAIGGSTAAAGAFTTLSASGAFAANGGATLGDASGDALTINSSAVSIPNGLNFDSNTLVIDATNNRVGIGTSSPGGLLQVGVAGSSTGAIRAYSSYVSIDANYQSAGVYGTAALPSLIFGGDDNTGMWHPASDVLALSTAGSERMRIDSSGNVGIGTSSPSQRLTVSVGDNVQALSLQAASGRLRIRPYVDSTLGIVFESINTAENAYLPLTVNSSNILLRADSSIQFSTNAAERMRIDSSGNVGIGTSSLVGNEKVNITFNSSGSITQALNTRDANASANNNYHIVLRKSDDAYFGGIGRAGTDTAMFVDGSSYLALRTGNTERMRIDSTGNLGLGVTPSAWSNIQTVLQIKNSSLIDQSGIPILGTNYFYNGTNNLYITSAAASRYYQSSGSHVWQTAPSGTAGNAITWTTAMTLDASGRLGIGVTNPSVGLVVAYGTDGIIGNYYSSSGANSRISFSNTSLLNNNVSIGSAADAMVMYTAATERMRIDSSGNVGIGTSSPTALLDVNSNTVRVRTARTPASAAAAGNAGDICWDANYIYVCTATNTWKRVAIATW